MSRRAAIVAATRAAAAGVAAARAAAACAAAALCSGCGDEIVLRIEGSLPVPNGVDAICLGIADTAPGGGAFGRGYRLADVGGLPQTLRVEAGSADAAFAWVRGDRGGVPVARASARIDFAGDVGLALDRCGGGPAAAPSVRGEAAGPGGARLAASLGAGGVLVVAVGEGASAILDADGGALVASTGPVPPAGAILAALGADLDGDCDDDLVVVSAGAAPALWRRDGAAFTPIGALGDTAVTAIAAADVDRDTDVDLVTGGPDGGLALWRNDGGGVFVRDAAAFEGAGRATQVRALALGDLDGDGVADLVVGQAGGPLVAWLGEPGGSGRFLAAEAAVPAVPLAVRALALADADGDLDLAVAVDAAPLRLYIDRDGHLEDQSFVRFPDVVPTANAIALGDWDAGCFPDVVIASDGAGATLSGQSTETFAPDATAPAGHDVVLTDLDDDGDLDAVLAGPDGVRWLAR